MANSELKTRVISAVFFVIILFSCIFLSEYSLAALFVFVAVAGVLELSGMARNNEITLLKIPAIAGILLVFGISVAFTLAYLNIGFRSSDLFAAVAACIVWLLVTMLYGMLTIRSKQAESLALTIFSVLYIAIPLALLLSLAADGKTGEFVPWRVMFLFFFMWASDTGAYFSGRFFGKHKLFERLSPKKTIEGFVGGTIISMFTGLLAWKVFDTGSWWLWLIIGAAMALAGTAGDLFESMFKRQFGAKDSGNLMPGHGGVLDRFDSSLLAAPIYWLLWVGLL